MKTIRNLFLMVLVFVGASVLKTSNAQDSSVDFPPQVIDVFPFPGTEMSGTLPLTISFSRPMDEASVEQNFSLAPELGGELNWLDGRTLEFQPTEDWQPATQYLLTIGATAQTVDDVPMESPFTAEIQGLGALEAGNVVPAPDAQGVTSDTTITVSFNRPVVALVSTVQEVDLPDPLHFEPAVSGFGEWISTGIYLFTPEAPLDGGQRYSVTLDEGLTGLDGAVMQEAFAWSFITEGPEVLTLTPGTMDPDYYDYVVYGVGLNEAIQVTFSQPMDIASTEAAFTLNHGTGDLLNDNSPAIREPVAGTFSWDTTHTLLEFRPTGGLQLSPDGVLDNYEIVIQDSALNGLGLATLKEGVTTSFRTVMLPGVSSIDVRNAYGQPLVDIRIIFQAHILVSSLTDRIAISPAAENWEQSLADTLALIRPFDPTAVYLDIYGVSLDPKAEYTITVKAGIADSYGNTMTEDYTYTFSQTIPYDSVTSVFYDSHLFITNAYHEQTTYPVMITQSPQVDFSLYRANLDQPLDHVTAYQENDQDILPEWVNETNLVRQWSETLHSESGIAERAEVPLDAEGGKLDPGLYWVDVKWHSQDGLTSGSHYLPLAVATANLTLKHTQDELFIWVTDLQSTEPIANAEIKVVLSNQLIVTATTDAQGVARLPDPTKPEDDLEIAYVTANGSDVFGMWYAPFKPEAEKQTIYIYTDRAIYRPGETVYFRGVIRNKDDMNYAVPDLSEVYITASIYDQQIYHSALTINEYGSFSGEFQLAEDTSLGDVTLTVSATEEAASQDSYSYYRYVYNYGDFIYYYYDAPHSEQISFLVSEFRVPEFEVKAAAQQDSIIQGDLLNVQFDALYYHGGVVGNAGIKVIMYGCPTSFNYTGTGTYRFFDEAWYTGGYSYRYDIHGGCWVYDVPPVNAVGESQEDLQARTDDQGGLLYTSDYTFADVRRPILFTVEGTVLDETNQPITGRTTVFAHPANIYPGIHIDRYFTEFGQAVEMNLIAVTPDSLPVPNSTLELTLQEMRWEKDANGNLQESAIDVDSTSVTTDSSGLANYSFTPPNSGRFRVRVTAHDENGRSNSTTQRFYVTQDNRLLGWESQNEAIELQTDRDSYKVGDTARILILVPEAGKSTLLITAERANIVTHDVVSFEGTSLLYELPISEDFAPTVHFTVTQMYPADETHPNPGYRVGRVPLNIEPSQYRVNVTLTPSEATSRPRDTVTFDVQTTDSNGKPISAEVGLKLTDRAILDLVPPNSDTLENTYYGTQWIYAETNFAIDGLIDGYLERFPDTGGGGGGGGGGGTPSFVREDFEQTPLWAPHVVTDENGRGSVSVELPDNLTTWQLDARALTKDMLVGQATTEIISTLPLIVRPVAPRFFVAGDRLQLGAVVNNNTEIDQTVEVSLQAEGVSVEDPLTQTIEVAAGSRGRVSWWVQAENVTGVELTFTAIGENGYQDAAKPSLRTGEGDTIPVYQYSAPDTVGTSGVLREGGSRLEGISLPTRLLGDEGGEVQIRLDPSLAAAATDALSYLKNYPHQCIEQTVSRFLPNIVTWRAYRTLGVDDPELEQNLAASLGQGYAQLQKEQREDGGWGWFYGMESDPLVSAYAALGLIEARDTDYAVDEDMLTHAITYVQNQMTPLESGSPNWEVNRQAFYLYVLARAEATGLAPLGSAQMITLLDDAFLRRGRMSFQAQAYLLLAYLQIDPTLEGAVTLASDLEGHAILSATGTHWEELEPDWWNWSSDTRTTALVLSALTQVNPSSELLPGAVRWLMVARQGDHWTTTQETVWATIALTNWMVSTGELAGDYRYNLSLNQANLLDGTVTPETVRQPQTLTLAVSDLLTDDVNRMQISRSEGTGALYYTTHLDLTLKASEVEAVNRGIAIEREYFLANDPYLPITEANLGDTIYVRVSFSLSHDIYYFVLTDPIPAGTEPIETRLNTSSSAAGGESFELHGLDDDWFWGWWYIDRTELRDQQANLYADFLPAGSYTYTYPIQATFDGEFQVMPSHAEAFYSPEIFGRGAGALFTISE